jgi:hypothetical protein
MAARLAVRALETALDKDLAALRAALLTARETLLETFRCFLEWERRVRRDIYIYNQQKNIIKKENRKIPDFSFC